MKRLFLSCLFMLSAFQGNGFSSAHDDEGDVLFDIEYGGGTLSLRESSKFLAVRSEAPSRVEDVQASARYGASGLKGILAEKATACKAEDELGPFVVMRVGEKYRQKSGRLHLGQVAQVFEVPTSNFTPTYFFAGGDGKDEIGNSFVPTGDIYVEFTKESSKFIDDSLDDFEVISDEIKKDGSGFAWLRARPGVNPIREVKRLKAKSKDLIVEPDFAVKSLRHGSFEYPVRPEDTLFGQQWHLKNRGDAFGLTADADANVEGAWQLLQSRPFGINRIAVIDDGFDLGHPDFQGDDKVVSPWNFGNNTNDPSPEWGDWHGTACAGVALGSSGGGKTLGANPYAQFIPIRWSQGLTDRNVISWFKHAYTAGADVISCSWGALNPYFSLSTPKQRAISSFVSNARDGKGGVVVFAAGNSNTNINGDGYLAGFAAYKDVVAVSASTSRDKKSHYSSYGENIWVAAPSSGVKGIVTSDVMGSARGYSPDNGRIREVDYTDVFGGTSSSCPLVAGVVSLMLGANDNLKSGDVKEILKRTARVIDEENGNYNEEGHSPYYGYGCVNAAAAVGMALEWEQEEEN